MKTKINSLINNLNIKKKVIIGALLVFVVGTIITNVLYVSQIREAGREAIIQKSKAITIMGEAMREFQAKNWERGVFNVEHLKKDILGKFKFAVPVFSAIITMEKKAEELNYEFRVPKFYPRNKKNMPDELEGEILNKMKAENLDEYYHVDDDLKHIRYFKPIKLTKDCLLCHGDPKTSFRLWGRKDGKDPTGGIMENWKAGEVHGAFEIIYSMKEFLSIVKWMIIKIIIINIILITGALIFLRIIVKKTLDPLDNISKSLEEINEGAGDLTKQIEILNDDEVGKVAELFNGFIDKLKEMVISIRDAADHVANSSKEMTDSSESLANIAQDQAALIEETSSAMEEIKATIDSVSTNAKDQAEKAVSTTDSMEYLNVSIKEINSNAQEANKMADDTHEYAIDGEKVLGQTVDSMKDIYDSSSQITEIVTIITDISDQINLLSLNASIEAARAGEHGKGFAVVAEEISKLADQTAHSSGEINKLIKESNDKINLGSNLVEKTANSLRKIITNVKETAKLMENIAKSSVELKQKSGVVSDDVGKVNEMSEEISLMMEEQSVSTNEIIKAINQVNEVTQSVASGSEELAETSEELSSQAEVLNDIVNKFKT